MCQRIDLGNGNFAIVCGIRKARRAVKLPATENELIAGGWRKVASRPCRLCRMPLDFYRTLAGKMMPCEMILVDNVRKYVSHFATCPNAASFKKPKEKKKSAPSAQGGLFQ